jgi:hypothetical protein
MLKVAIERDTVRIGPRFAVSFQRTLRIPDDGRTYPLPPGLGRFPVHRVADHAARLPEAWSERDGVFIPMYQREALWLGFRGANWKPDAVKVAVGGINVVSGSATDDGLHDDPQDYVVVPPQPWLDGINTGHGSVRQFVAMPLGLGYTLEAALTDREERGGIRITVFEPGPGRFPDAPPPEDAHPRRLSMPSQGTGMGLGAGGRMRQKIYADPHGLEVWDLDNRGTIDVFLVNSSQYREITGQSPPPTPIGAAMYAEHDLPWFDLYDEDRADVAPSDRLAGATTVAQHDAAQGIAEPEPGFEVPETRIKKLRDDEGRS